MNGHLLYAAGDDFDVRQEFWTLKTRVAAEDRYRGYFSAVRLLFDLAVDGFKPGEMRGLFEATPIENIMLFEDAGVRLAFQVPGNGRHSTPDIMLLAAEFCPLNPAQRAASHASFAAAAAQRAHGRVEKWPLIKPR
jgi:hypothetical protein